MSKTIEDILAPQPQARHRAARRSPGGPSVWQDAQEDRLQRLDLTPRRVSRRQSEGPGGAKGLPRGASAGYEDAPYLAWLGVRLCHV